MGNENKLNKNTMKKRFLQFRMMVVAIIITLMLGVVGKMYAYDFSSVCESGQTLYYNISGSNVTITHPNTYIDEPWSGYAEPEGAIVLPSSVTNNSITYSVTSIGSYAFREPTEKVCVQQG